MPTPKTAPAGRPTSRATDIVIWMAAHGYRTPRRQSRLAVGGGAVMLLVLLLALLLVLLLLLASLLLVSFVECSLAGQQNISLRRRTSYGGLGSNA